MAWKGLFQHLERLSTYDYHEFKRAHEIQIKGWWLYWSPNYVSIIREIMAPRLQRQPLALVRKMEVEVPMVLEPLEVMEVLRWRCNGIY
jgi:hypothetical protein